jgi:hypothetical protein
LTVYDTALLFISFPHFFFPLFSLYPAVRERVVKSVMASSNLFFKLITGLSIFAVGTTLDEFDAAQPDRRFVPAASYPAGWAVADWGVQAAWRLPRSSFRGLLTAIHDVLFPDRTSSEGMMDGEDVAEYARRETVRVELLKVAERAGVQALYKTNPDVVRYALAAVLGLLCMVIFLLFQAGAGWCARHSTTMLLRWMGEEQVAVTTDSLNATAPSRQPAASIRQRKK